MGGFFGWNNGSYEDDDMPNLADSLQCSQFLTKLVACERRINEMSPWEQEFVSDMRAKFNMREDQMDMGVNPWNPSANQSNTLGEIYEAYR
jgi:hypothetical protein